MNKLTSAVSLSFSINKDNLSPAPTQTKAKFAEGLISGRMTVRKNQAKQSMGLTKERIDTFKKDHPIKFKCIMAVKNTISFIASSAKTITFGHFVDTANTIKSCKKEISLAKTGSEELGKLKDKKIAARNELKKSVGDAIKELKNSSYSKERSPLDIDEDDNDSLESVGQNASNKLTDLISRLDEGSLTDNGAVFLASKALKFVNNMARKAGTQAKIGLNQDKINETAQNLKEAVTKLNDSCQGKGPQLESILRNPRLTTEDKENQIKNLFEDDNLQANISETEKTVQGCIDDIKGLLESVMTDEAQAGIGNDALKTGCWDAINMVTWAGLIYAGGAGSEAMRGGSGAEASFQNFGDAFMDHMSNPSNFTDQVMGADQFAQSMVEPSGIQASTTGMADWIAEAVLFKMEATVQGDDGGQSTTDLNTKIHLVQQTSLERYSQ